MVKNNIKIIDLVAKMAGTKVAPMVVESDDGDERKFYTVAST